MKRENQKKSETVRIVIATFPNIECARQIGTLLVESQLVACINLLPGVESIYQWEGGVNSEKEVMGFLKTKASLLPELEKKFVEAHPYDVPEFLVLEPSSGLDKYLGWVEESTREP